MLKKSLSIILTCIMLISIMLSTTVSVSAYRSSINASEVVDYMNGLVDKKNNYVGYCLLFVTKCWENMGFQGSYGWGTAANFANHNRVSTSRDNIPVGADVFFTSPDGNGHIGIYIGDGYFVHAGSASTYQKSSLSESYYYNRYTGWGWHPYISVIDDSIPQGHVMSEAEGAGQTIPDGDYWICSKIAQNYFLDIPGDNFNTQSGTNLQTWIWDYSISMDYITPGKWDAFHFKYLNNGFYQITQYNTNLAIDVANSSLDRGANVQMYGVNNAYAQQWSIEKTDSGYKLRARCNNYYMDIDSGIHKNGTNVLTWEGHDGIMQRFSFIPYEPDEKPLADGVYVLQSSLSKNCYLDVAGYPQNFTNKSNVQIYDKPDDRFQIEYAGNGYYRFYEAISKYAVEVINEPSYLDKNKNVMLYTKSNSRGQFWKIKENTDGTYFFINELSGYYMDVYNGSTEANTNVQLHPYNGSTAQRWIPYRVLQDDMVTVNDVEITCGNIAVDPQITVKVDGKTLTQNTDYTVTTEVDIASRQGTVTVTGKGGYCGFVTKEFQITVLSILGDADGDGEITSVDVTYIQRYNAQMNVGINIDILMNGDVDGNGDLEVTDATYIQRYLALMDTPYPIGEAK